MADPPRQQAARVTTLLPPPKALDTSADVWQSWTTWKQEFELFAAATFLNQQPKETSLRLMGFRSNSAPIMDHHSPASSFETSSVMLAPTTFAPVHTNRAQMVWRKEPYKRPRNC
ncbi:uncharacterized protein LOC144142085 [Haemaphysalis longicornis]